MVAPLLVAAAGVSAVGKLFGGITARSAAKARAKALEAAARQARREGGIAAMMGIEDDERLMARAATLAAKSGGGFGGSAGRVLKDLERQSAFKARSTIYRAQREANNSDYEAKVARADGRNALIGSVIGAASDVASAFAGGVSAGSSAQPSMLASFSHASEARRPTIGALNRRG